MPWSLIEFLVHLSRRLVNEYIGYACCGVKCRRPQLSNVFKRFADEKQNVIWCPCGKGKLFWFSRIPGHMLKWPSLCKYAKNVQSRWSMVHKKVQAGKDQEKAQSEKDSHSKNRDGKKLN